MCHGWNLLRIRISFSMENLIRAFSEKDKTVAHQKVNCAQQRMNLIDQTLEEYQAIDNKFPEDEYQRFIQKMNIMNTRLMPALQVPCK